MGAVVRRAPLSALLIAPLLAACATSPSAPHEASAPREASASVADPALQGGVRVRWRGDGHSPTVTDLTARARLIGLSVEVGPVSGFPRHAPATASVAVTRIAGREAREARWRPTTETVGREVLVPLDEVEGRAFHAWYAGLEPAEALAADGLIRLLARLAESTTLD